MSTSHLKFGCARMHVPLQHSFFIILNVILLFRCTSSSWLIPVLRTVGNIVTGYDVQTQVLTPGASLVVVMLCTESYFAFLISVNFLWFYLLCTTSSFAFLF